MLFSHIPISFVQTRKDVKQATRYFSALFSFTHEVTSDLSIEVKTSSEDVVARGSDSDSSNSDSSARYCDVLRLFAS